MKPVKNVTSSTLYAANAASGVPSTGQLIGDRYRLDRPLERGAMGSVWRAEQVRLRAPVAVKFLDPSLIGDREMHDRFMQEARSAAAVRSAHVVQVFDYGSEGGVPYIAMELLDGENLDSRLGSRGTLTPAELDRLFSELARGISQAHAIGVIHRDLKPGNIFLAREGEHEVTKIVDFGIAKVKATALRLTQGVGTQLGTLLGTPQYMSPEQVRGSGSIDHRTDLWALAIIACECLTGRCPFSGSTIGDLTVQICTEKPPAPSSLGPVPAGFDQWFFRATHKKPNKRFQTVEEMAERLHAVLGPALNAPGGARGGRLITLPSRSEVRLAYSAVVTWKGYVMSQLGQRWLELQKLWQELVVYLKSRFNSARERLAALSESERLSFMRPLMERHGIMASVALLCCGILMLGLTSRGNEPSGGPVSSSGRALQAAPVAEAMAAEPVAARAGDAPEGRPANVVAAAAPSGASTGGDVVAPSGEVTASNVPAAAADDALAPAPAVAAVPRSDLAHGQAPQNRASSKEPAAVALAPAGVTTPAGDKPMTKAMAQAAAKILNADELVAAPRKPAPRAQPRKAPRPRAHAKPNASSSNHPFDDRL